MDSAEARETYVYIIRADTFIKIGFSNDPEKRLRTMQTGSPHELEILVKIPCKDRESAMEKEREMHRLFSSYHHRGEWFYADCVKESLKIPVDQARKTREAEKLAAQSKHKAGIRKRNKVKRYSVEGLLAAKEAGVRLLASKQLPSK